jgi:nucleotide-binding universal stress UspA family protein
MRPSRLVLCATDLGEAADEALRQANAVCRLFGAGLLVVNAPPDPPREGAARRRVLETLRERVVGVTGIDPDGFQVEAESRAPADFILERAEATSADLVVVGARNASGGNGAALGTVAEAVVRHVRSPVLVARPSPPSGRFLAATDFSDPALPAVAAAVELARRRQGRVSVVHSIERPAGAQAGQEARARLDEVLARFGAQGDAVVAEGPAAAAVAGLAERLSAELVLVGAAGGTGVKRVPLGSVAYGVVRSAPCSVLVVRLNA